MNAPLFVASLRFWYENILQFKCTVVGRIPNPSKHTSPHQTSVLSLTRSRTRGTNPPIHGAVLTSPHGQFYLTFQYALVGFDTVRDRTEQLQAIVLNTLNCFKKIVIFNFLIIYKLYSHTHSNSERKLYLMPLYLPSRQTDTHTHRALSSVIIHSYTRLLAFCIAGDGSISAETCCT